MANKKDAIETMARSLGIQLVKPNGKKKTKKELCDEIEQQPRPRSRSPTPPRPRSLSQEVASVMAPVTVDGVVNSVETAEDINIEVADRIVQRINDSIPAVEQTAERIASEGADQAALEEIVAEDVASNSIKSVVNESVADGEISAAEGREIINSFNQPIPQEVDVVEIERREVPQDRVRYIEDLLVEIQKPRREIRNIFEIERKVFQCLGLVN
jgi:polyhydroxyalkanoate synthesis regulator phasin